MLLRDIPGMKLTNLKASEPKSRGSGGVRDPERILRSISLLADNPFPGAAPGSRYGEFSSSGIRCFVVSKQLVFYEVSEDGIEILRILYGGADRLTRLLGEQNAAERKRGRFPLRFLFRN